MRELTEYELIEADLAEPGLALPAADGTAPTALTARTAPEMTLLPAAMPVMPTGGTGVVTGVVRLLGPHFQICVAADGASVSWRLLSGNNRNLGRAARSYDGIEQCTEAISDLVARLDELQALVRPAGEHRWAWMLRDATEIVAMSGHRYDRQVRCEAARVQFIRYARTAVIDPDAMRLRPRRSIRL